jgi:hypothetical protein
VYLSQKFLLPTFIFKKYTFMEPLFNPGDLLWETRGRYWDYQFVSVPKEPLLPNWWGILNKAVKRMKTDRDNTIIYRGHLKLGLIDKRRLFLAANLQDSVLKDWEHRPINHRLIWFTDKVMVSDGAEDEYSDWYLQILLNLNQYLINNDVFEMDRQTIKVKEVEGNLQQFLLWNIQNRAEEFSLKKSSETIKHKVNDIGTIFA